MRVEYETAWSVWWIDSFHQWVVSPPDGYWREGEWVFLTNINKTYWPTRAMAWNRARCNAKKSRSSAKLYRKNGTVEEWPNYTGVNGRTRKRRA